MVQLLLDNSIFMIACFCFGFVGYSECRRYLRRSGKTPKEVRSSLRLKLDEVGKHLLIKLASSVIVTLVISLISFREVWMNDCFHIVFVASLLQPLVLKQLRDLTK